MARTPLMAGNWKMNLNHQEAVALVQKLAWTLADKKHDFAATEVVVCPPFTDIRSVQTTIESDDIPILLGAQHCHFEEKGAFTGEVSPAMLAKLNVRYVICGHSERREVFGETDDLVNKKVKAIIKHGMTPILCVGETLDEREAGGTEDKVLGQVKAGLAGVKQEQIGAIGTGRTATSEDAQAVCAAIRSVVGQSTRLQYGGSVKPSNIAELMGMQDIDGALVGGASLDPDEFSRIVQFPSG
jgi:triosephosphate isomerase